MVLDNNWEKREFGMIQLTIFKILDTFLKVFTIKRVVIRNQIIISRYLSTSIIAPTWQINDASRWVTIKECLPSLVPDWASQIKQTNSDPFFFFFIVSSAFCFWRSEMDQKSYLRMRTEYDTTDLISKDVKDLGKALKKLANHSFKLASLGFGTSFLEWVACFAAMYVYPNHFLYIFLAID